MSTWLATIHDAAEGTLHRAVGGVTEDEAYDEANIAAAELGCRNVTEIELELVEE